MLNIIDRRNLSSIFKSKIKDKKDLGDDVRRGRMVLLEMNKSYPVIIAPAMSEDELEDLTLKYLGYYYDDELPEPKYVQNRFIRIKNSVVIFTTLFFMNYNKII